MPSILIAYGTATGQTAEIARCMADALTERGFDVTLHHLEDADDPDLADYDAALLSASITTGRFQPDVVAFVERHAETLAERPSGFVQLSLAPPVTWRAARNGDRAHVDSLAEATGWEPDRVGLFTGTVPLSQLSWPIRLVTRLAAIPEGDGGDPSLHGESLDWDAVEDFAVTFGEFVEIELTTGLEDAGEDRNPGGRSHLRRVALAVGALGIAGAAYWAWRNRDGVDAVDPLASDVEELAVSDEGDEDGADGSQPVPSVDVEEPGSVPGETADVEQA